MALSIDFFICTGSILFYAIIALVFCIKIHSVKKTNSSLGKTNPKAPSSYILSLITSAVLILLPLLVPLNTWICAVICACGLMAEYIVFTERRQKISNE